jgi:hypothetical protein
MKLDLGSSVGFSEFMLRDGTGCDQMGIKKAAPRKWSGWLLF